MAAQITEMAVASTLTGDEFVPLVQDGGNVKATVNDIAGLVGGSFVPYTGATGDVDLGTHNITAANVLLGAQGNIVSQSLTSNTSFVWPLIWLTTNDDGGTGFGNPVCSITLENSSTTNCFGEIAFARSISGSHEDTWAMSVDPDRDNTEKLALRHDGQVIFVFAEDNSKMTSYVNMVLDGTSAKALQSTDAAGTATFNIMRVAGGDYIQIGATNTEINGVTIYAGDAADVYHVDAATGNTWITGKLGIGYGSAGRANPTTDAKLTIYGTAAEGSNGQMIRLGINTTADYKIYRDNGTGYLNFDGTQVGARGYILRNGDLSVPDGGITCSTDITARSLQVSSATTSTVKTTNGFTGYGGGLALSLWNTNSNNSVMTQFYNGVQDAYIGLVASDRLAFGCSTEVMSIKAATGNVLIGTTSDDGTTKLQVAGNVKAGNITGAASAAYTGTLTWTATTAPSGTADHTHSWTRVGDMVFGRLTIAFATAGSAVTALVADWPTGWPDPEIPSSFNVASSRFVCGSGGLSTGIVNQIANNGKPSIGLDATGSNKVLYLDSASTSARIAHFSVTYRVA